MATERPGHGDLASCSAGVPEEVTASSLPTETLSALTKLYGHGPLGRFLRGQHGITRFRLQEPKASPQRARIAVLSHGLGTELDIYQGPIVEDLLAAGWRVLSYDFLAHGWSVANQTFLKYDKEVFLTQIHELLDHILEPQEPVDLWVGHSTGGLVGILVALARTRPVRDLALISPALWADKPLLARIVDRIPNLMFGLASKYEFVRSLAKNGYHENNDNAFGKEGGAYLFPERHLAYRAKIDRKFELHPQAVGGILGIASFFLRGDLQVEWRRCLQELVGKDAESWAPKVYLIWGKFDTVVPFRHAEEVPSWAISPGRVMLVPLHAGHEAPAEVPQEVADEILKIAAPPASRL